MCSPSGPWQPCKLFSILIITEFPVNIFNTTTLSARSNPFPKLRESEQFAKAVCRVPLTAARSLSFAKPSLPEVSSTSDVFPRPTLPPLIRPLRAPGGFTADQLNRLFDNVLSSGYLR